MFLLRFETFKRRKEDIELFSLRYNPTWKKWSSSLKLKKRYSILYQIFQRHDKIWKRERSDIFENEWIESKAERDDASLSSKKVKMSKRIFKKGVKPVDHYYNTVSRWSSDELQIDPHSPFSARVFEGARERTRQSYPEITLADYARWKKIKRV